MSSHSTPDRERLPLSAPATFPGRTQPCSPSAHRDALTVMRGSPISVELVFEKATAVWARDRIWQSSQRVTSLPDGLLWMTLQVADTRELLGWILSFGGGIRVVSPPSLGERVRQEAARVAASATTQVIVIRPRPRKSSSKARQGRR
ncbi:MAG: WYL domain-containing protein [Candidatus Rokuibacteriota bacterium]